MNPIVSISCISFNHASYIRQCLESMLMQQTDFPFEIVIHDDASTDGTAEILKEYASKYPDRIFPVFQQENQYGKGVRALMARFNFPRCRGKYIALCEGDDFWTDKKKLFTQFQYLEQHPESSICFHDMKVVDGEGRTIQEHTNDRQVPQSGIMDLAEKGNFIWTASVMFRKNDTIYPDWYYNVPIGDYPMHLIHAGYGNIGFIPEVMGAYRLHDAGTLGLKSKTEVLEKWCLMLEQIKDKFSVKVNDQLNRQFLDTLYRLYLEYARQGDKGKAAVSIQRLMDLDICFLLKERERLEAKISSLKNSRLLTLSKKISQVKQIIGLKLRK